MYCVFYSVSIIMDIHFDICNKYKERKINNSLYVTEKTDRGDL